MSKTIKGIIIGITAVISFAGIAQASAGYFKDSSWWTSNAEWAKDKGLMQGNDGYFRGNDGVTRGELATVLHNMDNKGMFASTPDVDLKKSLESLAQRVTNLETKADQQQNLITQQQNLITQQQNTIESLRIKINELDSRPIVPAKVVPTNPTAPLFTDAETVLAGQQIQALFKKNGFLIPDTGVNGSALYSKSNFWISFSYSSAGVDAANRQGIDTWMQNGGAQQVEDILNRYLPVQDMKWKWINNGTGGNYQDFKLK